MNQPSSHHTISLRRSHRLRKANTRSHPATPIIERRVPILQERIPNHKQVALGRRIRPRERRHAVLLISRLLLPRFCPFFFPLLLLMSPLCLRHLRHLMFQPHSQRLVPYQPRKRRR